MPINETAKIRNEITIQKVDGKKNRADALTKHICCNELQKHMSGVKLKIVAGRSKIMPELEKEWKEEGIDNEEEGEIEDDLQLCSIDFADPVLPCSHRTHEGNTEKILPGYPRIPEEP